MEQIRSELIIEDAIDEILKETSKSDEIYSENEEMYEDNDKIYQDNDNEEETKNENLECEEISEETYSNQEQIQFESKRRKNIKIEQLLSNKNEELDLKIIENKLHSELIIKNEDELESLSSSVDSENKSGSIKQNITCYICDKKFRWKNALILHQRKMHSKEKLFKCDICGKGFNCSKAYKHHKYLHSLKPLSCDYCDKTFIKQTLLDCHKRTHETTCDICQKTYKTLHSMLRHKQQHFGRIFRCEVCNKTFNRNDTFYTHKKKHLEKMQPYPYVCDVCNRGFYEKIKLNRHQKFHTGERPFSCEFCHKKFVDSNLLRMHKIIHLEEKRFSCDICEKLFLRKSDLGKHKRTHTDEKPFNCNVCGKNFKREYYVLRHKKLTHSGDSEKYSCDVCDKKFGAVSYLVRHIRIHDNERPYKCDICDKTFSFISNMRRHTKNVHFEKDERVLCIFCDQSMCDKSALSKHIKKFHNGDKPFECRICDQEFTFKINFIKHKRNHKQRDHYSCDECDRIFADKEKLEDHVHRKLIVVIKESAIENRSTITA